MQSKSGRELARYFPEVAVAALNLAETQFALDGELVIPIGTELLILDEPVASLDPLARRDFLRHLMESVAENDTSVILSSHLVPDLERVCDYLIVLVASRVQLAGETEDLLAQHYRLVCSRRQDTDLPPGLDVIWAEHSARQSTFIVRSQNTMPAGYWSAEHLELEDLVLAYMERAAGPGRRAAAQATGGAR